MPVSAEIGPKLEKYVAKLVKTGRYNSKSEVIREGLRLLQEREAAYEELRKKIQAGIESANAGRMIPIEDVRERLIARYKNWGKTKRARKAA